MDISYSGKTNFKIKTKTGIVTTDAGAVTIAHKGGVGEDFTITAPGEYEVEGISVFGYAAEEATVYIIQAEDLRVLYLGEIAKMPSEKLVTELENIDVVAVPVDTLGAKEAGEVVAKLEPYYVLPYGENIAKFVASYEHGSRTVKSLSLSKLTLPEDVTEVIVFE